MGVDARSTRKALLDLYDIAPEPQRLPLGCSPRDVAFLVSKFEPQVVFCVYVPSREIIREVNVYPLNWVWRSNDEVRGPHWRKLSSPLIDAHFEYCDMDGWI